MYDKPEHVRSVKPSGLNYSLMDARSANENILFKSLVETSHKYLPYHNYNKLV